MNKLAIVVLYLVSNISEELTAFIYGIDVVPALNMEAVSSY
jgi:hypothetical protein